MIGHQSKLRQSLISSEQESENKINGSFIFYDDKRFTFKISFNAVLNHNSSKKVLVNIEENMSLHYLSIKIAEAFEQYPEYSNLEGLCAINLFKRTNQLEKEIPKEGMVKDYISNDDYILCDLIADQYWIKSSIKMKTTLSKYEIAISLDIKMHLNDLLFHLKLLLIKCAINCWLENLLNINQFFSYVCNSAEFHCGVNDYTNDYWDNSKVKDLFNFTCDVMECTIVFSSIEEYLFDELKKIESIQDEKLLTRMSEFRDMTLVSLRNRKDFIQEYNFIITSVKKYFNPNSNANKYQDHWYIYKRTKLKDSIQSRNSIFNETRMNSNENNNEKIIIILPDEEEKKNIERTTQVSNEDMLNHKQGNDYSSYKNSSDLIGVRRISSDSQDSNSKYMSVPENDNNRTSINKNKKINQDQESDKKQHDIISNDCISDRKENTDSNYPYITDNKNNVNINKFDLLEDFELVESVRNNSEEKIFLQKTKRNYFKKTFFEDYRRTSKYLNLLGVFPKKKDTIEIIESVGSYFRPKIYPGIIEKLTITEFRSFHVVPTGIQEDYNIMNHNSELNDNLLFNNPVKTLNRSVFTFIALLFSILIICIIIIFIIF